MGTGKNSVTELVDCGLDGDVLAAIRSTAAAVEGVLMVRHMRGRRMGPFIAGPCNRPIAGLLLSFHFAGLLLCFHFAALLLCFHFAGTTHLSAGTSRDGGVCRSGAVRGRGPMAQHQRGASRALSGRRRRA